MLTEDRPTLRNLAAVTVHYKCESRVANKRDKSGGNTPEYMREQAR